MLYCFYLICLVTAFNVVASEPSVPEQVTKETQAMATMPLPKTRTMARCQQVRVLHVDTGVVVLKPKAGSALAAASVPLLSVVVEQTSNETRSTAPARMTKARRRPVPALHVEVASQVPVCSGCLGWAKRLRPAAPA